jgi:5-methylcytosine-specific restriction endonuclease McrA
MWKVNLPSDTKALDQVKTALTYQDKTAKYSLTADEYVALGKIYKRYHALGGIAHDDLKGDGFSDATKAAIYNAYSEIQEAGRLKDLRSSLLLSTNYCPCCGILPADELDHHLPRSVYNLLALYSRNLVPLCHKCNNKKRTVTGINPAERFIHVYYDEIPHDVQFFRMQHSIINDALSFRFYIADIPELSEQLKVQMTFQIGRVKLNVRLKKEVNTFLSSFAVGLKMVYDVKKDAEAVKKFMLQNAALFKRNFGLNDWRTVTLLTLGNCPQFCSGGFVSILAIDQIPDIS